MGTAPVTALDRRKLIKTGRWRHQRTGGTASAQELFARCARDVLFSEEPPTLGGLGVRATQQLLVWLRQEAFVRGWRADGHLSAVMKDQGAEQAKEVLERKARDHKPSFLALPLATA